MTSRVISYVFRGDFGNMKSGLAGLARETDVSKQKLAELEAQAKKSNANVAGFGKGIAGSLGVGVASGGAAIGLAAAAGITAIVSTTANFDKAMSAVQAATHETTGNMKALREAALDAGQATVYSASESAGAIEELAKAGVSTSDILGGGLTGALDLAAAGALDVADAASIAATAMTQFGLSGDQVPHIADLLAAGAGKAQGSVQDLGMALNQSGLVASQMGMSIEETTGTLAAFASAGLIGSDAGTSFKTMLLRLANPSAEAAKLMRNLGVAAYDINGNFVGTTKLAGQLQSALKGQTQASRDAALATIFGSDAIRAANVLYTDGASGIGDWTNKVNDAGYAAETASIRLDNLSGDFEQLKGAIENAFIQSGEGSQSLLRQLTQTSTALVNLGGPAEEVGQSIVRQATGLDSLSASLKQVTGWFGIGGREASKAKEPTEQYSQAISYVGTNALSAGHDLESLTKAMTEQRKAALSAFDAATQYGAAVDAAAKAAEKGKRGISASTEAGRENRAALSAMAAAWNNQSDAVRNSEGKFRQARRTFIDTAAAMGVPIAQARRLARQLLEIPDSRNIDINANTAGAESAIAHINDRLASIKNKTVYVTVQESFNSKRAGIPSTQRASGGPIYGPGTATSDSIPAWLSNGEYVVKASSVAKYGVAMFDSLNAGRFAGGGIAGFATGGSVARGQLTGFGDWLSIVEAGVRISNLTAAQIRHLGQEFDDFGKKKLKALGKAFERATDLQEKQTEAAKDALDKVQSQRADLAGSVTSGLTRSLWDTGGSAFSGQFAAGSIAAANAQLRAQITDSRDFIRLEGSLANRGLSGDAFQNLLSQGGIDALRMAAASSDADLRMYQSLYGQAQTYATRAGTGAGTLIYGADEQRKQAYYDKQLAQQRAMAASVKAIEKKLDHLARDTGHAVADAHDRTARNVRRR